MTNNDGSTPSLLQKAYRYYLKNGFFSLATESLSYIPILIVQHQSVSAVKVQKNANNHKIWYDEKENPITISDPDHKKLRQTFEDYPKEFYPDRGFVCELQNCHLMGENAVALFQGDKLIAETAGHRIGNTYVGGSRREVIKYAVKSQLGKKPKNTKKSVFPLISPDLSYYHWMMEYLPKLRLLELYQDQTGQEPTILIEPSPPDFVYDTLNCAGYNSNRYEEWNQQNTTVENLVVSTHRPHIFDYQNPLLSRYNPSLNDFKWLRNRMRSSVSDTNLNSSSPERIYISRQNASRGRKIINYEEVIDVLQQYNFEPYRLENYTFHNQLKLFSEADIVMGPHGAGLLNAIFAENPTVIELYPETVIKPHFYFLSNMLNFEYSAIVTQSEENNLMVDIEKLDNFMYNIIYGS